MSSFVVMTRTFYEPAVRERVLAAADGAFPIFKKQPGLISIRMHEDREHTHTMTIMEWDGEESHEACLRSPDFGGWNDEWTSLMATGAARWELFTYEVLHEHRYA